MPVPSTLASLSTTPGSNSPTGGENPFPELDDHLRQGYAFTAQLRDQKLNSSAVSAYMLTVLDDANAATARTTLEAVGNTGNETIAGVKTFSSAPVSSAAASAANELMRKGEVDAALGGSASRAFLVGSATDPAHAVRRDQVPAEVKSALGASGAAPIYGCRAWVLFDMTRNAAGATDSDNTARFLYASGNVAQVVRSSPRSATVIFDQGLTPNGYTVSGTTRHLSGVYAGVVCLDGNDPLRSSQCDLSFHRSSDGNPITPEWVAVQFIGN